MYLYFKTKIDSETGKKFTELEKRGEECHNALKAFLDKYGFEQYRPSRISHIGGISACIDPVGQLDKKIWKETRWGYNEWMPKMNSKEGKRIMAEIDALPFVDIDELNAIVGYKGNLLKSSHIGYSGDKACPTHFGFVLIDEWGVKPPNDCEEITFSEYVKLFGKNGL